MDIGKEIQEKWPWLAILIGGGIAVAFAIQHLAEKANQKTAEQHAGNCQSADTCGLTIVIPTKNEARNIGALMECLKAQDPVSIPVKVIVVDGFSDDGTPQIAKKLGADIVYQDHGKVSRARNLGALLTDHPHLLFLDADTILKGKDFLARLVEHVHTHKVQFGTFYIETKGDIWIGLGYHLYNAYSTLFPTGCGAFWYMDRNVFFELKGFDEATVFGEDIGLSRRTMAKYPCKLIPLTVQWDERRLKKEGLFSVIGRYWAGLWTKTPSADELNAIDPGYFERSAGGKYYSDKELVTDVPPPGQTPEG